jgi:hypothetical protein
MCTYVSTGPSSRCLVLWCVAVGFNIASDYGISLQLRKRFVMVKVVFCTIFTRWPAVVSRSAFQQPTASYFYFLHLVRKLFNIDLTRIVAPHLVHPALCPPHLRDFTVFGEHPPNRAVRRFGATCSWVRVTKIGKF